jgi:hypothetical protein
MILSVMSEKLVTILFFILCNKKKRTHQHLYLEKGDNNHSLKNKLNFSEVAHHANVDERTREGANLRSRRGLD